ncbi:MAG: carboxypeptidase regulatory-like domain-containing protein [Clostridia bacterium]|nr:carboxypeptidase regulatory-like domain-containing protein [Clostridia bacterium]
MKKFFSLLFAALMVLSILPAPAANAETNAYAEGEESIIELSPSLTQIELDAFEGVENATFGVWMNSYAHHWCIKQGVKYVILDESIPSVEAQVLSIEICENEAGEKVISCIVTASERCILRADILDDEGKTVLSTEKAEVQGPVSNLTLDIPPSITLPRYFTLRAALEDFSGCELCEIRINYHYTSDYEAFLNQKPEDFASRTVLNYGPSGFAVLSSDVIPLNASATASGNSYTFETPQALNAGDKVLLNKNGVQTPVKIASVRENADGTVTIVEDENVHLSDMYDLIKVGGVYGGRGGNPGEDTGGLPPIKGSISYETVTVGYDIKVDVRANFKYDKQRGYFEADANVILSGLLNAFLGEEIDTWIDNKSPEIVLYNSDISIPFIDAPAYLKVSLPLNINAEVGGKATVDMTYNYGYHYNPLSGWTTVTGRSCSSTAEIDGKFSLKFGPEISLNLNLFKAVEGRLSGQAGILLEGKAESPFFSGSLDAQDGSANQYHACYRCIDMDYFFDINARGAIKYDLSETLSGTPADVNITLVRVKLGDLYYSIANDVNSVHEGKTKFGFGVCPNNLYRTSINTLDMNGTPVSDVPLALSGSKLIGEDKMVHSSSPLTTYLYPGAYLAAASFESGDASEAFEVSNQSLVILIQEKLVTVEGVVTDENTKSFVSDASISLTLPDGSVKTALTDSNGRFRFDKLPAGIYSISAGANGYMTETISNLNFEAGSLQHFNFDLLSDMPDRAIMLKVIKHMGDDMVQRLKAAGFDVYGSFSYHTSGLGDPILKYMLSIRVKYPVYEKDKELFRECAVAIVESGAFPLTEAQVSEVAYAIGNARGVDMDIRYDNGFSARGAMPVNDVTYQFDYAPEINADLYSRMWSSNWTWDTLTYNNGRNLSAS